MIKWNPEEGRWEQEGPPRSNWEAENPWDLETNPIPSPRFAPGDVIRDKSTTPCEYQVFVHNIYFNPFYVDYHKRNGSTLAEAIRSGIIYGGTLAFAHSGDISDKYITPSGGLVPVEDIDPRHIIRQRDRLKHITQS